VDAFETFRKDENQRVKVEILPISNNQDILQVAISDNGCGMADVQKCVDAAFQSSKEGDTKTAGRYGIGLTLRLLHAQRLVPNSYASIPLPPKKPGISQGLSSMSWILKEILWNVANKKRYPRRLTKQRVEHVSVSWCR
jgi:hypothetical protein